MLPYSAVRRILRWSASTIGQEDGTLSNWPVNLQSCFDKELFQCWIGRESPTLLSFLLRAYVNNFVFSVRMKSQSHMKESVKKAIEGISTQTLEEV